MNKVVKVISILLIAVMVIAAMGITVLAGKDAQRKIKQRREDREMFR